MSTEYGEVFTRRWVVELMLDLAGYTPSYPLLSRTVVEPAIGGGAFVGPIVERLIESLGSDTRWEDLRDCIRGFDIQPAHVAACKMLAADLLEESGCSSSTAAWLAESWFSAADFLLADRPLGDLAGADLVIGNPPYIRIEDLDLNLLKAYRSACPTMTGRSDLFVGFYERGLKLLKPNGRLAYICADRWMRNSYGRNLRSEIQDQGIAVDDVLTMHGVQAFESDVSAYPAITVLRRGTQGEVAVGTATKSFSKRDAQDYFEWRKGDRAKLAARAVTGARMASWHKAQDWPDADPPLLTWLAGVQEQMPKIEDAGVSLAIGIATGADAVFIPSVVPEIEGDRLVPMAMPQDVRGSHFTWSGRHLVNPWDSTGVVALHDYPQLERYMRSHEGLLRKRNVAQRSPSWYRTIDRINPILMQTDYIAMQDMKLHAHPVRVPAGYYPHHNLTALWSQDWDLDVLGGLLLSEQVEAQVGAHCVRMRGGTLRFQPTVLRKVRVPAPHDMPPRVHRHLAEAFRDHSREAATRAAWEVFPELPDRDSVSLHAG